MLVLYPCPVCGEPGKYRSWEPYIGTDEHGEYHSTREVCLVCAKRGPRRLRIFRCWVEDRPSPRWRNGYIVGLCLGCAGAGIWIGALLVTLR